MVLGRLGVPNTDADEVGVEERGPETWLSSTSGGVTDEEVSFSLEQSFDAW